MNILFPKQAFFFAKISAQGFSLMRIGWALTAFCYYALQSKDVLFFYGDNGILPPALQETLLRNNHLFSILLYAHSDATVFSVYILFLTLLLMSVVGMFPKISTALSVLLLFSFHERNILILGGGDTVMRIIGFLLLLAPRIDAFSLSRIPLQWAHWKNTRTLLPAPKNSIWIWRLLLWQVVMIYLSSVTYKLMGEMWRSGTAIATTLQHPDYTRFPAWVLRPFLPYMFIGDYAVLLWQALWVFQLVPSFFADIALSKKIRAIPLRRFLLLGGILFHGSIYILMDAGLFSLAMFCLYIGLLREEDFMWMRSFLNTFFVRKETIAVLYDGQCGLCLRSVFALQLLDNLHRLNLVNFRDVTARNTIAPDVTEEALDKALHIKTQNGRYLQGFYAFRHVSRHIPLLWPVYPFLFFPGIPFIGERVYARIANRRSICTHGECRI